VAWDQLTDEQREIRDLVRTLARERIAPRAAEIDESHEFPWDVVELYRENDIFGLFFEAQYGGLGTGTLLALIAIEEVSKVCATSGLILAVQELGSLGLKLAGSDEQKDRYLPRLASGEWLCAFALTESGSGSDSAAMRTTARRDGDEYVLNGSKRFIRVARLEPKMGISGSTTGELTFDDVRVPAANLLGEEGEGFKIAMRILDRSAPRRRGAGARHRTGRDRLRPRLCEDARDDGAADRVAPAHPGEARRHGDRVRGRARVALPLRPDGRRGRRRRRADQGVRDRRALSCAPHRTGALAHWRTGARPSRHLAYQTGSGALGRRTRRRKPRVS
jgi:hypothetical protein